MAWGYYAGGARDEITLQENQAAWSRLRLYYRVLAGVGPRDLSTTLLGAPLSMPILAAPTAFQRLAHPDGECATAQACGAAGVGMVLSTLSTTTIEEVSSSSTGPLWFQLYLYRDRGQSRALVERAVAAGCQALVLTVDAAIIGTRERDARNRFHLPAGLVAANLMGTGRETLSRSEHGSALSHYVQEQLKTDLSWSDLEWLRAISPVPVLIKGLVHPGDATQAIRCGASGLVVSNHGGRQLDTAPSTAAALPAVIEAVGGRIPVLVDGGIRRGTDIVKAMAMGAAAVLVGRPVLWGLAVGGAEGVRSMLEMLRTELDEAMALCGCASLAQLPSDLVRANGGPR
jgi:4-hydroxymandelate oxidase